MRWPALAASAIFLGVMAGCFQPESSAIITNKVPPNVVSPSNPNPAAVTRSQKPESLLDTPPEVGGDLKAVQVCASIRATVNGKAILNEEVRESCFATLQQAQVESATAEERTARQKQILTNTLELLVERELLLQDALGKLKNPQGQKFLEKIREVSNREFDRWLRNLKTQLDLKSDEEVKDWLHAQGLSIESMRKHKANQYIAEEYLRQMVMPFVDRIGHEEIVEYYRQHPEEFQVSDSVKWQDLFVDAGQHASRAEAKQVALQLVKRIRAGEDFLKLAELYDRGFPFTHADGNGQKRGQIRPPEVEHALFTMRDNDVTIVEMPTGFHIVRMVKRTYAGRMPLDDRLQNQIRDKLRNEVGMREQKRFLSQLKTKATIEYSHIIP
jgi:peptidyl-prolyl cis-trans isomerase C